MCCDRSCLERVAELRDTSPVSCRKIGEESRFFPFPSFRGNGQQRSVSAYANRYLFTGREYHLATELYYYRARWYSPTLGRFLSRDPIGKDVSDNPSQSLYVYCNNLPTSITDPTGQIATVQMGPPTLLACGFSEKRAITEGSRNTLAHQSVSFYWYIVFLGGIRLFAWEEYGEVFRLDNNGQYPPPNLKDQGDTRRMDVRDIHTLFTKLRNRTGLPIDLRAENICKLRFSARFILQDDVTIRRGRIRDNFDYTDEGYIAYRLRLPPPTGDLFKTPFDPFVVIARFLPGMTRSRAGNPRDGSITVAQINRDFPRRSVSFYYMSLLRRAPGTPFGGCQDCSVKMYSKTIQIFSGNFPKLPADLSVPKDWIYIQEPKR